MHYFFCISLLLIGRHPLQYQNTKIRTQVYMKHCCFACDIKNIFLSNVLFRAIIFIICELIFGLI